MFYRCIKKPYLPSGGSLDWVVYDTLQAAYRKCIPENEIECYRKLFHTVAADILKGETLILVSSDYRSGNGNVPTTYWIECIEDEYADMPPIEKLETKPPCCK